MSILSNILKDSNYGLTLFENNEIEELERRIIEKDIGGQKKYFVNCIIRDREIQLKPEEIVRQLYTKRLIDQYNYPKNRIKFEHAIHFGREVKAVDVVVFDKDNPSSEYILVEVKKPKLIEGKKQLYSYCNATGAPIAIWSNGGQISYYNRKDPNFFEDITDIPKVDQSLEDIIKQRFTLKDLFIKDKIPNEGKSLKQIILELENDVLANAGVDVFEEVFKLIFTKLFDEIKSKNDKVIIDYHLSQNLSDEEKSDFEKVKEVLKDLNDNTFRVMDFRNTGQSDSELKRKIQNLFNEAKDRWHGVFPTNSEIDLSASHLSICVSSLQDIKLFNSNLQIIDEAFEYLVNKSSKGEKGQFFTPRHVIDMCVKMLNPKAGEYMIDPASGSCGFPVHTIFYITGHLFNNKEVPGEEKRNVLKIFGIDFDEKAVRVARTLNLIAGDGETNVLHMNSLDYSRWNDYYLNNRHWLSIYGEGFARLERLKRDEDFKNFNFDIVMANPPFAGDIKETRIIHKYELGFNKSGSPQNMVGRDILFIERNLDFLKPGGRMAIVLPQGRLNNISNKNIREYIAEKAKIIAVVSLHINTFKPHAGTKTSVLFLQKWDDGLCPKKEDYPIFFAVSEKGGKDNSGEYIYIKNGNGQRKLDKNGHFIIDHDLHNNNGELPDGIAEAFIDFAKNENLSFWN